MSNQFAELSNNSGFIEVITGPMFSGKTEELIIQLKHYQKKGLKVICIKPAIDDRYHKTQVVSHDNSTFTAYALDAVEEISKISIESDVIGIDEAQFFHESIAKEVVKMANSGKKIIISGLNLDYKGTPFTTLANLMALAQKVIVKKGLCAHCENPSTHTARKKLLSPKRIVIGGSELYEPRCRKCFSQIQ